MADDASSIAGSVKVEIVADLAALEGALNSAKVKAQQFDQQIKDAGFKNITSGAKEAGDQISGAAEKMTPFAQRTKAATDSAEMAKASFAKMSFEARNLGFQLVDVTQQAIAGQSAFMILAQQGGQLAQIFALAPNGVGALFKELGSAFRGLLSPMALVATGVTAVVAGFGYAVLSFQRGQADIERSLAGVGGASRASVSDINAIAEAATSSSHMTVAAARSVALTYVNTGKIIKDNIGPLVGITEDFARATGTDIPTAAERLAKAFADPAKGAADLNAALGGIDGKTIELIRSLDNLATRSQAQQVLFDAIAERARKAGSYIDPLTRLGDIFKTGFTAGFDALDRLSADLSSTTQSKLQAAYDDFLRLQELSKRGFNFAGTDEALQEAADKVRALRQAMSDKEAKAFSDAMAQMAGKADDLTKIIIPQIDQIQTLEKTLKSLQFAQSNPQISSRQGFGDDFNAAAIRSVEVQLALSKETTAEADRHNARVLEIAQSYKGVSIETALTLDHLKDQLAITQATDASTRLEAQEQATINQLKNAGVSADEASAIAASQRAVAQAQLSTQEQLRINDLQQQLQLIRASSEAERMQLESAFIYDEVKKRTNDTLRAQEESQLRLEISQARANKAVDDQIHSLEQQNALIRARLNGNEAEVAAAQAYDNAINSGADSTKAAALQAALLQNSTLRAAENCANIASECADAAASCQSIEAAFTKFGGDPNIGPTVFGGDEQFNFGSSKVPLQSGQNPPNTMGKTLGGFGSNVNYDQLNQLYGQGGYSTYANYVTNFKGSGFAGTNVELNQQGKNFYESNVIASQLVGGADPNELLKQLLGAPTGSPGFGFAGFNVGPTPGTSFLDAVTKFQTILDLEKRAGISPQQTINEITSGKIGQGVPATQLLQALDELRQQVQQNSEATKANTAALGVSSIYSSGHAAIGYYNYGSGGSVDLSAAGMQPANTNIPQLADGGVIPPGMVAYVGEHGPNPRLLRAGNEPVMVTPSEPASSARTAAVTNVFNFPRDISTDRRRSIRQASQGFTQGIAAASR